YVRDDRPFAGPDPPAAVFFYSRNRGGEHPSRHLAGYAGILQTPELPLAGAPRARQSMPSAERRYRWAMSQTRLSHRVETRPHLNHRVRSEEHTSELHAHL